MAGNVYGRFNVACEGPDIVSCKQERKLQRQEAKPVARKAAAAAARDKLQTIEAHSSKRVCSGEKYGEVALPPAVLQKVISFLARIEADGVRGPSMAASDLAIAALASWDFYNAAKHGFAALEAQAAQLQVFVHDTSYYSNPASVQRESSLTSLIQLASLPEEDGWTWEQWATFLQDPLQYKVAQLKQAAWQVGVPVSSSKAELVVNILQAFGLQQPSSVAPQLLRAVLLERCWPQPWAGCEVVSATWKALQTLGWLKVDCSKQQLLQLQREVPLLRQQVHDEQQQVHVQGLARAGNIAQYWLMMIDALRYDF
uniref:SAP domain-containing protein n=1 Tax=Tetradesmus obliquus TaxID=3088 RepID=A0A383WDH8_TETOB|eukprot:jgi/Sobl393_1/1896/SZX75310.1